MRLTDNQIKQMVKLVFDALKEKRLIEFKVDEGQATQKAIQYIHADFEREKQLDEEINKMMDQMEAQHPGEFQRYKMFPLLKKKMAKEKGLILWSRKSELDILRI